MADEDWCAETHETENTVLEAVCLVVVPAMRNLLFIASIMLVLTTSHHSSTIQNRVLSCTLPCVCLPQTSHYHSKRLVSAFQEREHQQHNLNEQDLIFQSSRSDGVNHLHHDAPACSLPNCEQDQIVSPASCNPLSQTSGSEVERRSVAVRD